MSSSFVTIHAGIRCYLLPGEGGFVLIDTGPAIARRRLLRGLEEAGCRRGDLRLVVISHGDTDHTGSCADLQTTYGATIGAHPLEVEAIESGDMRRNRQSTPDRMPWYFKATIPLGSVLGRSETVHLDRPLEEGESLEPFGVSATVLHLPGHSRGSIGVLTDHGDLFCGDLFWNVVRPRLHPLLDDVHAARESVRRLRQLPVDTIHPAHGRSFPVRQLDKRWGE